MNVFDLELKYKQHLKVGLVDNALRKVFENNGYPLSDKAIISKGKENYWRIVDARDEYKVKVCTIGNFLYISKSEKYFILEFPAHTWTIHIYNSKTKKWEIDY
ncbi:MAG: hypothetical protein AB1414_08860 [bacterium]